jgi:serine/threonine-protein kinase
VIAVLIVVAAVLVSNQGDSSPATTTSETPTAVPNTGPFTGTFTVDFGPAVNLAGKPVEGGPPPYQETWRLRSVCRASGCVATASTGGRFIPKEVVFDDVGGRWLTVVTSQDKCRNLDSERFDVVWLQPRPDGTMSGEKIAALSMGCYAKRSVTFTRTGDTDVGALSDPASQPPRVVSPAEALHGRYHMEVSYPSGTKQELDLGVRTDCLRTGDRCMSYMLASESGFELVFGNGKWTRTEVFDVPCSAGGTSQDKHSAEFPLPQPPQDPITLLSGRGHKESTGTACLSTDYNQKFVRTGD